MSELDTLHQKLETAQHTNNRQDERSLLDDLGNAYFSSGEFQQSLAYYKQGLQIDREISDHQREARTLNAMALIYDELGEPRRALDLLQETLAIVRAQTDRDGEATTLNDMALVYQDMGDARQALDLLQQVLSIREDMGDEAGKATTLNNMAGVYHAIGEPYRALAMYRQTLPIFRNVHHRAGEAATLNNMALVHRNLGEPQRALEYFQQTLPIRREVGEQAEEAATLNGLASVLTDLERYAEALDAFEQSIQLQRQVNHHAGESASLVGAARILYRHLNRREDAISYMEQAIATLEAAHLSQDAAGHTADMLHQVVSTMQRSEELGKFSDETETLSVAQTQQIVGNTIAVMTVAHDKLAEWRTAMIGALQHAHQHDNDWQAEAEFFQAILNILNDHPPALPADHPYAAAVTEIRRGIKVGRASVPSVADEIVDPSNQVATLNHMALAHKESGQFQQAHDLLQQARDMCQQRGDQAGEAMTLSNMAELYHATGDSQQALDLYQQSIDLYKSREHHRGEAATLNKMAMVYRNTGQPHQALELYMQSVPICQNIQDRACEASMLSGRAAVLMDLGRYAEARTTFEQSATIEREIGNQAGEAACLIGAARLLHSHLNQKEQAIAYMEQAIGMLEESGLSQDAAGHTTAMLKHVAATMRQSEQAGLQIGADAMSADQIQQIISNTIAVMTVSQDKRAEWHAAMEGAHQHAQKQGDGWQHEAEFFAAVLALLEGTTPTLAPSHPYAQPLTEIVNGVQTSRTQTDMATSEVAQAVEDLINANADGLDAMRQVLIAQHMLLFRPEAEYLLETRITETRAREATQDADALCNVLTILQECIAHGITTTFDNLVSDQQCHLPFGTDLVPRTIDALTGTPDAKIAHIHYMNELATQTTDEQLKALIRAIQVAMLGGDVNQAGDDLTGVYQQAWQMIVSGVTAC